MADLAKGVTETVPAWDGNPRGWRRYSREVLWYVMGTKKSNRPFLAPRLIAKLTGPARLLAMSWSQVDFRGKTGVKTLLTQLAESPLVRKNLPNTSAVLNQYFNYKGFPNETIANYLVRESLYFEEFNESLLAFWRVWRSRYFWMFFRPTALSVLSCLFVYFGRQHAFSLYYFGCGMEEAFCRFARILQCAKLFFRLFVENLAKTW